MQNFEQLGRELERRGKTSQLRALAESEDGAKLATMVDGERLARAAKSGDGEALREMLGSLLSTDEGRRLAERIRKTIGT